MADPFSIIAVTQTGLSVAESLTKIIRGLQEAPSELLALSNEIWNLKLILDDASELRKDSVRSDASKGATLDVLVYQAKVKLDELNKMTTLWGKISRYGDTFSMGRKDRFLWLKEKSRVIKLQREIKELRCDLSMAIGTTTSSTVSRMEIDIQALVNQLGKLTSEESISKVTSAEDDLQTLSAVNAVRSNQQKTKQTLQDVVQNMSDPGTLAPIRRPSHQESENHGSDAMSVDPVKTMEPQRKDSRQTKLIGIPVTERAKNMRICSPGCPCPCHIQTKVKTPEILKQIAGRLFLGYTGNSVGQRPCISSCYPKDSKGITMTYFFPTWFAKQAIFLSMSNTSFNTPTFNLKLRRVVPEVSPLFTFSKYNAAGVRKLFDDRLASPDDVHIRGGWSPLHVAVDHGCVEVCQLLLDCGADPSWEDATGVSSTERAWHNILALRESPQVANAFAVLFPGSEYIQDRRFSRLHRLVLELEEGSITEEVKQNPQLLNAVDIDGWTPLHWACCRGSYNIMCALLELGADPFLVDGTEDRSPLHVAAQCNSLPCIEKLLQYRRGNRVLDIEIRDVFGQTPLWQAAEFNSAAAVATYISHGADINARNKTSTTPILAAVAENSHEALTQLINAGADYTAVDRFGNTILHLAAGKSDAQTLVLLKRAHMRGINVEAKNVDGSTAAELAIVKHGNDEILGARFEALMKSLELGAEVVEMGSPMSVPSEGESWKSFEDEVWDEAERAAKFDVEDGEEMERKLVQK